MFSTCSNGTVTPQEEWQGGLPAGFPGQIIIYFGEAQDYGMIETGKDLLRS